MAAFQSKSLIYEYVFFSPSQLVLAKSVTPYMAPLTVSLPQVLISPHILEAFDSFLRLSFG